MADYYLNDLPMAPTTTSTTATTGTSVDNGSGGDNGVNRPILNYSSMPPPNMVQVQ